MRSGLFSFRAPSPTSRLEDAAGNDRRDTSPGLVPRQRHQRPRALLIGLGVLICAIICVGTLALSSRLYRQSFADHRREVHNLAISLAEQTDRALLSLDNVQRSLAERVADAGAATPQEFAALLGQKAFHRLMREKMSGLPHVDALSVIDSSGRLVSFTRHWPAPNIDVSNRDYFIVLSSMKGPASFVSEPVTNLATGAVTIILARRVTSADGTFLGVLLGTMEQASFEQNFANIDLQPSGLIALVRDDGALLARVPGSAAHFPRDAAARAQIAQALFGRQASDQMVAAGILDEHERVVAVDRLAHFPLAAVMSDSVAWLRGEALKSVLPVVVAAALVCILIGLIIFFVIRQLDGERAYSEKEHHRARYDALTGLPNRLFFSERLASLLARPGARPLALLFIDLDYFKTVNDTLGHDIGDALLQGVSERLLDTVAPHDFVARLGGDEFAIICHQADDDLGPEAAAQSIIEALRAPFLLEHHQVLTGCSVGIALSPRDGTDVATLLKCADLALYGAKNDGRGNARRFEADMGATARARRDIELHLHEAWEQRQFRVVYQPIFEATSGRLAGFEALLRWHHPTRGEVPPERFIPVVEESGLILKVGNWILNEACRAAAAWPDPLFISVNVSPAQFRGGHTYQQVGDALAASGLVPSRLELEITESLLLKADTSVRTALDQFRAEGIILALDDFGTGYSSLRYLQILNISRLKIDQSFIRHVVDDRHTQAIVKAILSLAQALELKTTAEGIENEAQLDFLKREGCTHLQGYLLGPPMSEEEACRLVRDRLP
ncbi:bifunctional diguanylate cyclase/phosphodiesterase [Xanthobacter agilis]|uniref:Diguanylate cyclase (GGDEF)-like protein n=1 Tax=Xanthobacter agilis TaxID=47492 RepID=A0ABU0LE96_XANAG|nr:EAL domain-containing protein [Xanthobacter agilis]MDQ0505465.1 diguanylate cyclase (GGDEF)-like protein [Xanthobacter agilis]